MGINFYKDYIRGLSAALGARVRVSCRLKGVEGGTKKREREPGVGGSVRRSVSVAPDRVDLRCGDRRWIAPKWHISPVLILAWPRADMSIVPSLALYLDHRVFNAVTNCYRPRKLCLSLVQNAERESEGVIVERGLSRWVQVCWCWSVHREPSDIA